jgi:hypothetical protein
MIVSVQVLTPLATFEKVIFEKNQYEVMPEGTFELSNQY